MRLFKLYLNTFFIASLILSLSANASTSESKKFETPGPFKADGRCPVFKPLYSEIDVRFGNRGLSVLNSFYETIFGKGAFELSEFRVITFSENRFDIVAQSNRGALKSEIFADRLVRIGQDNENEKVRMTHQSAFCDKGRIFEHQVVYSTRGNIMIQDLLYWTEGDTFRFRLYQNRNLVADVYGL